MPSTGSFTCHRRTELRNSRGVAYCEYRRSGCRRLCWWLLISLQSIKPNNDGDRPCTRHLLSNIRKKDPVCTLQIATDPSTHSCNPGPYSTRIRGPADWMHGAYVRPGPLSYSLRSHSASITVFLALHEALRLYKTRDNPGEVKSRIHINILRIILKLAHAFSRSRASSIGILSEVYSSYQSCPYTYMCF